MMNDLSFLIIVCGMTFGGVFTGFFFVLRHLKKIRINTDVLCLKEISYVEFDKLGDVQKNEFLKNLDLLKYKKIDGNKYQMRNGNKIFNFLLRKNDE